MTPEQTTAATVLRKPMTVHIGKKKIKVKPLTLSTLIEASAIVSTFPQFSEIVDTGDTPDSEILAQVLTEGYKYGRVGEFLATLALGYSKDEGRYIRWKKRRLEAYIMSKVPTYEINGIAQKLLGSTALKSFFHFTASLSELNLLRPKRKENQSGGL